MIKQRIFLYGPPGTGKSAVGRELASTLNLPFTDLDVEIVRRMQMSIPDIFEKQGEESFRAIERKILQKISAGVIALGGGALLEPSSRNWAESNGQVVLLTAPLPVLLARLRNSPNRRPLLGDNLENGLAHLMRRREDHYGSFSSQIDTDGLTVQQTSWQVQTELGLFHIHSMGDYRVSILNHGLETLGTMLQDQEIKGRIALISDENVSRLYAGKVLEYLQTSQHDVFAINILPGERHKNLDTLAQIWDQLLENGLGRDGLILALGGGVVSDLAGFAAATYLRGIRWAALPTSLLAMVDASLGGKTGIDLPRGKNLAGAFYPPQFVLMDPTLLTTLPQEEWRSGFAEIVKHAVIADPALLDDIQLLSTREVKYYDTHEVEKVVRRACAVKIKVIERDPFEKGQREALNFGHTVGHAVESASGYEISHGEAVSIGMVVETALAEEIGLAEDGLAEELSVLLSGFGLPTSLPSDLSWEKFKTAFASDKKRRRGEIRFSLPVKLGKIKTGVVIEDLWRKNAFNTGSARSKSEPFGQA